MDSSSPDEVAGDFESAIATSNSLLGVVTDNAQRLRRQYNESMVTEASYVGAMAQLVCALRVANRQLIKDLAGYLPRGRK